MRAEWRRRGARPLPGPDNGRAAERAALAALGRTGAAFFGRFGRLAPIQTAAIPVLLSGRDALLCAPTAGGKTEAVAAPLAERYLASQPEGLWLLYVCPTRALVNDLYRRLEAPLTALGIGLGRKTSDHPVTPKGLLEPWLLTTPESFDSLLVRRPRDLAGVAAVVLDEIHLLDGTPRGDQLRLLLARLRRLHVAAESRGERSPGRPFQTALVSATISDPEGTAELYAPGAVPIRVEGRREIRTLGVKLAPAAGIGKALASIPRDEAAKLLIFTRSRAECEEVAAALFGKRPYGRDVYAHHASLSRRSRLAAEEAFHRSPCAAFVATTTLELGIDIGDVDWVVQFGPPASVGSFLQQIGRGCRRRRDLTQVLAVARSGAEEVVFEVLLALARQGAVEAPSRVFAASVLVQQTASYLLQRASGTVGREELGALLAPTPGREPAGQSKSLVPAGSLRPRAPSLSAQDLEDVLRRMSQLELIVPARAGRYAVGPALEQRFEHDARRLHTNLGTPPGMVTVVDADTHERLGEVRARGVPAAGRVAFGGRGGTLVRSEDDRLFLKRHGAGGGEAPKYWTQKNPMALSLAQAVRAHLGLPADLIPLLAAAEEPVAIFTFLGGCANRALAAHLKLQGLKVFGTGDAAILVDRPPLLEQCCPGEALLGQAVDAVWKSLERLQEPGAHASSVPDSLRRRQVLARLLESGVLGVLGCWKRIAAVEGGLAEALRPFRV